ncbi:MAG: hypothetical protein RLZ98_494 [Pseudomonadota bacterium]|jgi:cholesterol oxidase
MNRLSRPLDLIRRHYDAIVVGSGYGGGVAAMRLARAGRSVAVLERGREFATGEFPARLTDLNRELRVRGKRTSKGSETALFDVRLGRDMHVILGCGLGGGSLVNAAVALRPDPRVFAASSWPGQIAQDGLLDEGFRRATRWLRPARDPDPARFAKYRALQQAGEKLSAAPVATPLAVSFEDTVNPAGIAQSACTGCGDCCAGCNVGAKNTVALTYLPAAAAAGAEIFTLAEVRRLLKNPDSSWAVEVRPVAGESAALLSITADVVVLAAGTLGSTEILLRSREAGLALSDRLGARFSANGDIIAFGYGVEPRVEAVGVGHPLKPGLAPVGASVCGQIEFRDPTDFTADVNVQDGVLPSAVAPALPVMFLPDGRLLGALQSLISGVYNGKFAHLQTFFAVGHDSASGALHLEDGDLSLSWPDISSEPALHRLDAILRDLVGALGGDYVQNPLAKVVGREPATAHPLGGATMGRDCASGVVDHKGRVFSAAATRTGTDVHTGLYVLDGAAIPRSLGVNPLFTITALAERGMLHFCQDHGLAHADL